MVYIFNDFPYAYCIRIGALHASGLYAPRSAPGDLVGLCMCRRRCVREMGRLTIYEHVKRRKMSKSFFRVSRVSHPFTKAGCQQGFFRGCLARDIGSVTTVVPIEFCVSTNATRSWTCTHKSSRHCRYCS